MSKHDAAYIAKFQPMTLFRIEELIRRLVDRGPLWYRGPLPEEGRVVDIISDWLRENGIESEENK